MNPPQVGDTWTLEGHNPLVVESIRDGMITLSGMTLPLKDYPKLCEKTIARGGVLTRAGELPLAVITPLAPVDVTTGSDNAHARLAPSSSKRWSVCTGSVAYLEANAHRLPKDTGSTYADEGTEAHEWAAKSLLGLCPECDIPDAIREPVLSYVDYCRSLIPEGVKPQVETQVALFYQPDETGTVDFAVLTDERVSVADYKHGMGVLVESAENSQLAIYAYSLITMVEDGYAFTDDTVIDLRVFQPRHREAHTSESWVLTLAELREFCKELDYKATQARVGVERVRAKILAHDHPGMDVSAKTILEAAPGLKFVPQHGDGGSCRWCPAKGFCEVRLAAATEELAVGFTSGEELLAMVPDLDKAEKKLPVEERVEARFGKMGVPKEALTDDYLVRLFAASKWINSCLSDVEELLEQRVLGGERIPGTKLVLGRAGNRDWVSEEAADKFLKNQKLKESERYDYKLKSPTKIEALLKDKLESTTRTRNLFDSLVTRSNPKKVLALASDKREAVEGTDEGFSDETGTIDIDAYEV